jgi:nucleoside 2-deoxyribosyltransferase
MNNMGLIYLATPYSKMADIDRAFEQAARVAAKLSLAGMTVFAPIAHSHPMVRAAGLDHRNPAVYAALNRRMLCFCDVLVIVLMEGWRESDGIKEEFDFFEAAHKPIYDCDPFTLRMMRRSHRSEDRGRPPLFENGFV